MTPHSIFNDVLGPVMAGPSSSHSAGCARIGLTVRNLYGKPFRKVNVVFDEAGSYPTTYQGQGSDFGFTGGLTGMHTDDPRLKDAIKLAAEQGYEIRFSCAMLSHIHPNEARIDILDEDGRTAMSALTLSTGGGSFVITELDGFPVKIDGSSCMTLVECLTEDAAAWAREQLKGLAAETAEGPRGILLSFRNLSPEENMLADSFTSRPGIRSVRHSGRILPVILREGQPAFTDARGALEYNKGRGLDAAGLALEYESSIGDAGRGEILEMAARTLAVMRHAAYCPPDPSSTPRYGFLPYRGREMQEAAKQLPSAGTGCLDKALLYAVSVMENSCAHNTVAAAPTAGSSGVVPAALLSVGESLGCGEEAMVHALLACGLTGAFIANLATFGAEVAGCQAENGAASAMAASGVVSLLGGTAEQGFMAASLALQNMLGLICDPVGGLTEIPCIGRNVAAAANAVTAANMVMLGFDPAIPLDETIEAMLEVGKLLPASLRCTCGGGLCSTPSGRCLAASAAFRNT